MIRPPAAEQGIRNEPSPGIAAGRFANASEAWQHQLALVLNQGTRISPRGRETLEVLNPSLRISMQEPVVAVPRRGLNYAFMAAEAVWMISGDDTVEGIAPWCSNIARFSDDGETFFGAYGPRINAQASYVVNALLGDRDTRQATMTIWRRNPPESKDIPCLGGNTQFRSPEGNLTIRELSDKFESGEISRWPVIAWDPEDRTCGISWMTDAWKSGVKEAIRVHFDDGSHVDVTPDHTLWKKVRQHVDGDPPKTSRAFPEEVKAGDLEVGDRVYATHFITKSKHDRPAFIKDLATNWSWDNQVLVQDAYAEKLYGPKPEGYHLHHKDNDQQNNRAENIEYYLSESAHNALNMRGDDNPMRRETAAANAARRDKVSASMKEAPDPADFDDRAKPSNNHKIVAIEPIGEIDVYDFTVPGKSNAALDNGVFVHNCTVALDFKIRDGLMNCHAFMRSSDTYLGLPYDIFNFSMVSAWIACTYNDYLRMDRPAKHEPVGLGDLFWTASSSHVYLDPDFSYTTGDVRECAVAPNLHTPGQVPEGHPVPPRIPQVLIRGSSFGSVLWPALMAGRDGHGMALRLDPTDAPDE